MSDTSAARLSRRGFLHLSTVGGLALALEACTPSAPPSSQPAAPAATQAPAAPAATQAPAAAQSGAPAAAAQPTAAPAAKPAAAATGKAAFPTYVQYKNSS